MGKLGTKVLLSGRSKRDNRVVTQDVAREGNKVHQIIDRQSPKKIIKKFILAREKKSQSPGASVEADNKAFKGEERNGMGRIKLGRKLETNRRNGLRSTSSQRKGPPSKYSHIPSSRPNPTARQSTRGTMHPITERRFGCWDVRTSNNNGLFIPPGGLAGGKLTISRLPYPKAAKSIKKRNLRSTGQRKKQTSSLKSGGVRRKRQADADASNYEGSSNEDAIRGKTKTGRHEKHNNKNSKKD